MCSQVNTHSKNAWFAVQVVICARFINTNRGQSSAKKDFCNPAKWL